MTRWLFDGGEVIIDSDGNAQPNFPFTVWTDRAGGTNVTASMVAPDGVTVADVQSDSDGEIPYLRGPDGMRGPLYRDTGTDTRSPWYSSEAMADLATQLTATQSTLATTQSTLAALQATVDGLGTGGLPAGTTLDSITDGSNRYAVTSAEKANLVALKPVATTGLYTDLNGTPAAAIPLTQKGAANGVATLDVSGKLAAAQVPSNVGQLDIRQGSDGTWPLRNTVTSDPNAIVNWRTYSAVSPMPQAGNGYFGTYDILWKKV